MIPKRQVRLVPLALLLACSGAPPFAASADHGSPKMVVMGDTLACPKTADGEIAVCGETISATSVLNLHAYASCLVVHHRIEAGLAARAYALRGERDPLRALVADDHSCMPQGGARMSAILLASALTEHLPGWRGRLHAGFGKADRPSDMIHCVIATNARLALAVLRSAPLSKEEATSVQRLVPTLPACLSSGTQLETNRVALRAMLALALLEPKAPPESRGEPPPPFARPATPLIVATPRIVMAPLAIVGASRSTSANMTVPAWTQMPETGLIHGDYGHPDLAPPPLPEQELAKAATGPFGDDNLHSDPLGASFPGASSVPPSPQEP